MKRYINILLLTVFCAATANAQLLDGKITITGLTVVEVGDKMDVSFQADIAEKSMRSDYTFVFAPVLSNDQYKVSMPPVVVQGKRAQKLSARYEWVAGAPMRYDNPIYAETGTTLNYSARVESQLWMQGADVIFESVMGGCCTYLTQPPVTLAQNLKVREELPVVETLSEPVVEVQEFVFVPETLADTLSISFPFVANVTEFDREQPFRIYDDERENALIVYFRSGNSTIDRAFRGNEQILYNLTEVVRMINNDLGSEVEAIVVGGFSSPEGGYEINDRLAFERAVAVKEHIVKTTGIPDRTVLVYNGSVDWRGLRYMISKSDAPERDKILDIIDNVPIWDAKAQRGRLGELMRLNNGAVYHHLNAEYFPLMRNGAFIKVYYKNK